MWVAAIIAGAVHVLFFCMESLWWTTPSVRKRFGQSAEQADASKLLAFNQGFYNLFLAIGTFVGLALTGLGHERAGLILASSNCLIMLGAAVVLAASAPRMLRGALIQGAAPMLFLVLAAAKHAF
jgi:putative membrane protein